MDYQDIVNRIYSTREVRDARGVARKLTSEVSPDEGELLGRLIDRYKVSTSLEIGCAYGLSSLYICQALARQSTPNHTIIDPFQSKNWGNIGVDHLREAGCDFFSIIEELSEIALPKLLTGGAKYDMVLIDGLHTFDQALVDFYFADRMLRDGGIMVFDDVHLPCIRMVCRYVMTYGNYQVVDKAQMTIAPFSAKRHMLYRALRAFFAILPQHLRQDIVSPTFDTPDQDLGLTSAMIAMQKTHSQSRPDHWFKPF